MDIDIGVELRNFAITNLKVRAKDIGELSYVQLIVTADAKDLESGEATTELIVVETMPSVFLGYPRIVGAIARQLITKFLTHELDECLYLNGERLCVSPHPEKDM